MLTNLLVEVSSTLKFFVTGRTMLLLAGSAVETYVAAYGGRLNGSGTYVQPWVLCGTAADWLAVSAETKKNLNSARYMQICGRYVKMFNGYYVVDDGGVEGGRAWDQPYVRKTDRDGDYASESGKFDRGGPSYGQYMKRMNDQQRNSHKHLPAEAWSKSKATKLRKVLKADGTYASKLGKKGDLSTGQLLPALAATMFLAEPARNRRCFLINLMLLDMIELGFSDEGDASLHVPYTWGNVLWNSAFDHKRGGLLPAARTDSAKAADIKLVLNPTQEHEVDVLLRYFSFSHFSGTTKVDAPVGYTKVADTTVPVDSDGGSEITTAAQLLGYIKYLMVYRLRSGFG